MVEDPWSVNHCKIACAIPWEKHSQTHFHSANEQRKQGEIIKEHLMFNLILHCLQMKGFGGIIQKPDCDFIPKKLNSLPIKNIQETPEEISLGFSQPAFEDFFKCLVNIKREGCVRVRN